MVTEKKKVFYGWIIVLAGCIITGAGVGIYNNCNGVFVKPVCDAMGFARGQFTLYSTISMLTSTLMMPFYGELFRKYGVKRFMLLSAVACGLVPIGYSFAGQLWHFYVLAFVNGLLVNGISMMVVGTLVSGWFRDKKGMATGLAYAGSGLSAAVMIPVAGQVIERMSWRWAYRLIGCTGILILLPIILLLVRERPEDMGLRPYTEGEPAESTMDVAYQPVGLTRAEALKTPTFWLLVTGITSLGICAAGAQNHTVSYLSDIGYSVAFTSAIASAQMLVMTAGKILLGLIFDRFGALAGSIFVGVCSVCFPLLAMVAHFPAAPWGYAFFLGFAASGGTVPTTTLTSKYFGDKDFASIFSLCSMASSLGVAIGSPLMGTLYDIVGDYSLAWVACLGFACLVAACFVSSNLASRKLVKSYIE